MITKTVKRSRRKVAGITVPTHTVKVDRYRGALEEYIKFIETWWVEFKKNNEDKLIPEPMTSDELSEIHRKFVQPLLELCSSAPKIEQENCILLFGYATGIMVNAGIAESDEVESVMDKFDLGVGIFRTGIKDEELKKQLAEAD